MADRRQQLHAQLCQKRWCCAPWRCQSKRDTFAECISQLSKGQSMCNPTTVLQVPKWLIVPCGLRSQHEASLWWATFAICIKCKTSNAWWLRVFNNFEGGILFFNIGRHGAPDFVCHIILWSHAKWLSLYIRFIIHCPPWCPMHLNDAPLRIAVPFEHGWTGASSYRFCLCAALTKLAMACAAEWSWSLKC